MKSSQAQIELDVTLQYEASSSLYHEEDFILTVVGKICGYAEDAKTKIHLGELKMYFIQSGNALNEGASLYDVFDTYQQTMDAGCVLFDSSLQDLSPWIQRRFEEASPYDDILILDRLTIHPLARGQRLGLAVLYRAIHDWSGGCSLVVMKPYPLQYEAGSRDKENEAELKLEEFRTSKTESFRRLRGYYAQLGFERIARSNFYVLCVKHKHPSRESLSLPSCITISAESFDMFRKNK
jgi:GNAT superfamily N-acetyltransferase